MKIIIIASKKGILILNIKTTKNIANNWPIIAIHLIFIRFPSKIVFIKI